MQRDEIQIEAEKIYTVEEAREDALVEGEAKGKADVAMAMLAKDFPADVIASVTGLSEEQVLDISKSL